MGCLLESLYDILFQPKVGMEKIGQHKQVGQAIVAFLLSMLIPILAFKFAYQDPEMTQIINIVIVVKVLVSVLFWLIGSAILSLIAEFFGGTGTAKGVVATLGFAHLPRIFIVPLWLFATAMPASSKIFFMSIAVLIILCWSLYLELVAIQNVHHLSMARAGLVIVTPMLLIGSLCMITFVFASSIALWS